MVHVGLMLSRYQVVSVQLFYHDKSLEKLFALVQDKAFGYQLRSLFYGLDSMTVMNFNVFNILWKDLSKEKGGFACFWLSFRCCECMYMLD